MEPTLKPCLKVVGLHIEGLKTLRKVDWPEDGMAWGGEVPDLVMVGGVNGSGKTTLLELLAGATGTLLDLQRLPVDPPFNAWIDLKLVSTVTGETTFRVVIGDPAFVEANRTGDYIGFVRQTQAYTVLSNGPTWGKAHQLVSSGSAFASSDFPSVVYFPTDRRLSIPEERYRAAGKLNAPVEFAYRFRPAEKWDESIEAVLYSARWADLNAKDQGRPSEATHFDSYSKAFDGFFQGSKQLLWTVDGELVVKVTEGGALHPLAELSSGEKQAILFAAELYRRWRPGSLILIDEPELHFHPSWQAAFWLMLERWQKERGGQVIVTTQSNYLFGIAEPGTTTLLGRSLG